MDKAELAQSAPPFHNEYVQISCGHHFSLQNFRVRYKLIVSGIAWVTGGGCVQFHGVSSQLLEERSPLGVNNVALGWKISNGVAYYMRPHYMIIPHDNYTPNKKSKKRGVHLSQLKRRIELDRWKLLWHPGVMTWKDAE
jgi:hypothetical protein